ncbi:hypothetical protein CDD80_5069 [Ophiocordyceps camponoti-rufipedis]|uniref:Uncharacterized protein n=1 Tax=Ophiocordyceps camponoti-rufipedis TaxID=2004952 RepID=A0A2C5YVW4_9HYPO|nr:hypothetical protein CDD80_5069 [Ophiocordyceps camponoti-rufipedis]
MSAPPPIGTRQLAGNQARLGMPTRASRSKSHTNVRVSHFSCQVAALVSLVPPTNGIVDATLHNVVSGIVAPQLLTNTRSPLYIHTNTRTRAPPYGHLRDPLGTSVLTSALSHCVSALQMGEQVACRQTASSAIADFKPRSSRLRFSTAPQLWRHRLGNLGLVPC